MKIVDYSSLSPLKDAIEELIEPLEAAQSESRNERKKIQSGLDLIMGDLTMVALLLTNVDLKVTESELGLINGIRRAVYGESAPLLNSDDYLELCREFLRLYPQKHLSVDSMPSSIEYLLGYDEMHKTEYSMKARELFVRFAEAVTIADSNKDAVESIILENFKAAIGYPVAPHETGELPIWGVFRRILGRFRRKTGA